MLHSLLLPKFFVPKFSPPLYLAKALLLLCALALLLLPLPSYAGHWVITLNGSTTASNMGSAGSYTIANSQVTGPDPYTPDNCPFLTLSGNQLVLGVPAYYAAPTLSVAATLTWTPDYPGDMSQPPSTVDVLETATASDSAWLMGPDGLKFDASDGFDDTMFYETDPIYGAFSSGRHLSHKTVSAGQTSVTLPTRSLASSLSFAYAFASSTGGAGVNYKVEIETPEAIPVNFHQDNVSNIGNGNLEFHYDWDSSTGNKADLGNWSICETVTYANNPAGVGLFQNDQDGVYSYFPPDPFEGHNQEPTQLSVPATVLDGLVDDQLNQGFSTPYKEASYIGTQKFIALNKISGIQMSLLGPFTITRSVDNTICTSEGDYYEYTITKNGSKATLNLGTGL